MNASWTNIPALCLLRGNIKLRQGIENAMNDVKDAARKQIKEATQAYDCKHLADPALRDSAALLNNRGVAIYALSYMDVIDEREILQTLDQQAFPYAVFNVGLIKNSTGNYDEARQGCPSDTNSQSEFICRAREVYLKAKTPEDYRELPALLESASKAPENVLFSTVLVFYQDTIAACHSATLQNKIGRAHV